MSDTLNILFIGDIVGLNGLAMVTKFLKSLAEKHDAEAVIVNGENIYDGKALNKKQAEELFAAGAHIITTGNHIWERWETRPLLREERRILRPLNYPRENGGSGYAVFTTKEGTKVGVLNVQGRVFLPPIDDPFKTAEWAVQNIREETPVILVDMHAEASAEKQAMGFFLDGKVSAVLGTHTHVQTADERILPKGTAYITDVGMTGPHDSIIGVEIDAALGRFLTALPARFETATENPRLNAVIVDADEQSGRATDIERLSLSADDIQQLADLADDRSVRSSV